MIFKVLLTLALLKCGLRTLKNGILKPKAIVLNHDKVAAYEGKYSFGVPFTASVPVFEPDSLAE